jgi:SAM-dependent methyltransferase
MKTLDWKLKAFIQNSIALLPATISYELYFQMQRYFGGLKKPYSPMNHFSVAVSMLRKIQKYMGGGGGGVKNVKKFFLVGTGRVPLLPVAFWLCGAEKIVTVDLNPYVRNELVTDMLFFIKMESDKIKKLFDDLLIMDRFNLLLDYCKHEKVKKDIILKLCQIEYIAPGDAARVNIAKGSVNYHISHTVYEHIPLNIIADILNEGNRIVADDGLFINSIDYGDHFSYMDKNISVINFLQYDDETWDKYAGNRYMYMNRARHDEFIKLFEMVGHDFLEIEPHKNKEAEKILERGDFVLDQKFRSKK